jgi:CheY-like chemotaxis protein
MSVHEQTVLLVEDNPDDALLTRRAFTKAGIPKLLQVVGDGERAVAYLAGNGDFADRDRFPLPLLVLLDLKLPRRSGFEVLEWLRVQPGLRRLPVVVLTSSDQSADVNRAFDLGANSYLVKPVKFDALLDMVKALNLYWLLLNEKPELQTS